MDQGKLALDMLTAIMNVLEEHDIRSKDYVNYFGKLCDEITEEIINQELDYIAYNN